MRRDEFGKLMGALTSAFRVEATRPLLEGYWMGLHELRADKLTEAIKRAMRECEYMPSVGKLRAFAGKPINQPPYHRPAEPEMERIERCGFHRAHVGERSKDFVSWCRPCQRERRPALPQGQATAGELVHGTLEYLAAGGE